MTDYFFIEYVRNFCRKNDIGFTISDTKLKEECAGCLLINDNNTAHLKISTYRISKYDFLLVLLHEFGHALQFIHNFDLFKNKYYDPELLQTMIGNKESQGIIRPYLNCLIDVELDNIKQLPSLAKDFNLQIDEDYLIRSENWLLYRYLYWAKNYMWMNTKKEYSSQLKYHQMLIDINIPNNFKRKFRYLPKKIEESINDCCYSSKF